MTDHNFYLHDAVHILCESDGRHYWHPERMTWRPHFELKAVS